jgi:hypothetical protein
VTAISSAQIVDLRRVLVVFAHDVTPAIRPCRTFLLVPVTLTATARISRRASIGAILVFIVAIARRHLAHLRPGTRTVTPSFVTEE